MPERSDGNPEDTVTDKIVRFPVRGRARATLSTSHHQQLQRFTGCCIRQEMTIPRVVREERAECISVSGVRRHDWCWGLYPWAVTGRDSEYTTDAPTRSVHDGILRT